MAWLLMALKKRSNLVLIGLISLLISTACFALPFSVSITNGTTLPTYYITGTPALSAYYTVTNTTQTQLNNNYVKYLPPNVSQVITGSAYPNICGTRFNLSPGASCVLQLAINGGVNGNDPNPDHHLFVCLSGGLSCAGTAYELNVSQKTIESLSITPTTATINLAGNTTLQYLANLIFTDNSKLNVTSSATWNSSHPSVATISSSGLATSVATGSTNISATYNGTTSNNATLTVGVVGLTITPANATISAGFNGNGNRFTQQYTAIATYGNGKTANVTASTTWSSNNAAATISSSGLATAATSVAAATPVTITAQYGAATATATLTVEPFTIAVTPASATINAYSPYNTQQYTATATYYDGSTANITPSVTWSTSPSSIASISTGGLATGLLIGSTTVTAALGATSNSTSLTIAPVTISISPLFATVYYNASQQYTATATFWNGATADVTTSVTWSSSDISIATINSLGIATSVLVDNPYGYSTISASLGSSTSNFSTLYAIAHHYFLVSGADIEATVIDPSTGYILPVYPSFIDTALGDNITDLVSNSVNGFIYALKSGSTTLYACSINASTGALTCNTATAPTNTVTNIIVNPAGNTLYLINPTTVYYCPISSTTGAIGSCTATASTTSFNSLTGLTISTTGNHLYVADNGANLVYQCTINSDNSVGACQPTGTLYANPGNMLVASNAFAYILSTTTNDLIYICPMDSNEALGSCTNTTISLPNPPYSSTGDIRYINPGYSTTTIMLAGNNNNKIIVCSINTSNGQVSNCNPYRLNLASGYYGQIAFY